MDQDKPGDVETGTRDETYDIIAVLYHALQGAENCELYAEDAEDDQELRQFFERAGQQQREIAEQGKALLQGRLARGGAGGSGDRSAFGQFGSEGSSGSAGMSGQQGGTASGGGMSGTGGSQQPPDQFGQAGGGGRLQHTETSTGGGGTSSF